MTVFISDHQWAGNRGDDSSASFWANQPHCSGDYRLASQCHGHPGAVFLEMEQPHAGGIGIILNNRHISFIFNFFLFLAVPHDMRNLSFPTRDRTHASALEA